MWPAREVPLGGVRAMTVSRTLPQRGLPTVGAWCFLDSFGPDRVAMSVLPHPHTGLQTVTWPLAGTIRHRDSVGSDVIVRPGELNIMTAGRGVSHSEFAVLPGAGADGAALVDRCQRRCERCFDGHVSRVRLAPARRQGPRSPERHAGGRSARSRDQGPCARPPVRSIVGADADRSNPRRLIRPGLTPRVWSRAPLPPTTAVRTRDHANADAWPPASRDASPNSPSRQ